MNTIRAAFVMEQTLGHVTHYQNLAMAVQRQSAVLATWVLVPFATAGLERLLPAYGTNWSIRASFRARRDLRGALAARAHDALFFHTQVTSLFSVGLMRRHPAVVSLDATPLNYDTVAAAYGHKPATGSWLDAKKHAMNRAAFEAAAALVTWSQWARASLAKDYGIDPAKVTVLAPGAAETYFDIGRERMRTSDPDRPVRLLFVGGDFVRKGGPVLLEAMAAMRADHPVELHIVTQGPVDQRPGVFVHRNVRPNSAPLYRLFREADAFVLPSRGECLSVVLMEASAAGLPMVSTDVGALTEAARDRENAIVVPPGDARALRAALEALVNDAPLRTRLGRAGHALATERFDAQVNDALVLQLIARVAHGAESRRVA